MNKYNKGMSLIETMVSLVVTLGLIGGAMTVLMYMQKSTRNQESRISLTQESRFVLKQLVSEIRNSGSVITIMGSSSYTGKERPGALPFYGLAPLNNTDGPDGIIVASATPYFASPLSSSFSVGSSVLNLENTMHSDPNMVWRKDDLLMVISKDGYVVLRNTAEQISSGATSIPVDAKPVYYSGLLNAAGYADRSPNASTISFLAKEGASTVLKLNHFGVYLLKDLDLVRISDFKGLQNPFVTPATPEDAAVIGVIGSNILDLQIVYRSFGDKNTFPNTVNLTEYFKNGPSGIPGTNDGSVERDLTRAFLNKEIRELQITMTSLTSEFRTGSGRDVETTLTVKGAGDRDDYTIKSNTKPPGSTSKLLPNYFRYRTYEIVTSLRNFRPQS